jgi:pimeloyl-ACP methyl ester carboxylesterase
MSIFPEDLVYAPREWGERYYTNIIHWNDVERGGHFAAWEEPEHFVREVRDCFRQLRRRRSRCGYDDLILSG